MVRLETPSPNASRRRQVMETIERDGKLVVGVPGKTTGSGGNLSLIKDPPVQWHPCS